jgi:serine phosphatase RsbU (regulator of sigma subunit)
MHDTNNIDLLYRLSGTISSSLDLDDVLEGVMDEVVKATHAERGFIVLTEPVTEASSRKQFFYAQRGIDMSTIDAPDFRFSRGVVEQVIHQGEPLLTSDAQTDSRLASRQSIVLLGLRSILCVPLKTKDKILGVIYIDSRVMTGIFTQSELELVHTIANHAAVSIENARLFLETQNKLETLRILYEIMSDLTSTLEVERVLTSCLQRVQTLLNAAASSILTLEGDELVFQVALGEKSEVIRPFRIPRGKGLAGWVVEHGEGVIVNQPRSDPRFYTAADADSGFTTDSVLAVPLIVNDRTIGVLEVFNKPGGFGQADADLLTAIGASAAVALENARLYQTAVEKGRMERELQVARGVQASLLPSELPRLPGWEFASRWLPARQVGGDYYDAIPCTFNRLGLFVADVTDKGIPAALFMAFTRSIVRASLAEAASPATGITHANRLICSGSTHGLFVTMFYALLDPAASKITWVNAGHHPALHYHAADGQITRLTSTGMPLGVDGNNVYRQQKCHLEPGDLFLLYTDGITEAQDAQDEQFGVTRLENILQAHGDDNPDHLLTLIEEAVRAHVGNPAALDDITLLIIKRQNPRNSDR